MHNSSSKDTSARSDKEGPLCFHPLRALLGQRPHSLAAFRLFVPNFAPNFAPKFAEPRVENAPTCYRAPRWPDLELPRKIQKKYPHPEILDSQNLHPKYAENTKKKTENPKNTHFGYVFDILGECIGVPEFRPGVFLRYFSSNSGSGHLGALQQVGVFLDVENLFPCGLFLFCKVIF